MLCMLYCSYRTYTKIDTLGSWFKVLLSKGKQTTYDVNNERRKTWEGEGGGKSVR